MQIDYLFNAIQGYKYIKRFSYLFNMENKDINKRYKILKFFDKYGLNATKEAFNISRRTIYRWKLNYIKSNKDINSLKPKSTRPKRLRETTISKLIVDEIKRLREIYPNIGKAKIYILLEEFCKNNNFK